MIDDANKLIQPMDLADGLWFLRERQRPLIDRLGHRSLDKDTMARYALALVIEAAEFANEAPWKLWKKYPGPGTPEWDARLERMQEELVDILHFIGTWLNFLEMMGVEPLDVAQTYERVNRRNHERLDGDKVPGYGMGQPSDWLETRSEIDEYLNTPLDQRKFGFKFAYADAEGTVILTNNETSVPAEWRERNGLPA